VSESPETTPPSAERYWLNEQGWLTPHPEGQWVHVKDVGIDDEWLLDAARATVPAGPEVLRLLRYLWAEADLERPGGGPNPVGSPGKVRELFRADDPLSVDIEAALAARPVPAADDRERLYVALNAEIGDVFGDDLSRERFDRALLRAGVSPSSGDAEHALHFDPDCEECAYLARPTRETLGSPPTGDASLREAAQRVSDKASVIARGGASPRWVVDDATFSALRAALSTGDADRLHEAIRAVYYEDKHPDLSGGLTTDPADARLAAAILRRLG
jgi:hypothetical protein